MRPHRIAGGYSLIELLVVLVIVSLLATIGLPLAELARRRTQEEELRAGLREIRNAIDEYKRMADAGRITLSAGDSGYPPALDALVDGVPDARSPKGEKLYFLRRLPRDPFAPSNSTDSWALRSYQSPPDQPVAGRDVFDVHSRSQDVGLNGVPYAKW